MGITDPGSSVEKPDLGSAFKCREGSRMVTQGPDMSHLFWALRKNLKSLSGVRKNAKLIG